MTMPRDPHILFSRLSWLMRLRWYAITSIAIAILLGKYVLGIDIPVPLLLFLTGCMAFYNFYYTKNPPQTNLPKIAFQQLLLDTLVVSVILFFSGGFLNPFFTFYFFLVIIAWIILPTWHSTVITIVISICFALQGFSRTAFPVEMRTSDKGLLNLGEMPFHVIGAPISFVLTTIVTAYFVSVIMKDLRQREQEVQLARQRTELELKKLDNILRHQEAGMLVLDSRFTVDWVNDRLKDWFGSEGAQSHLASYRFVGMLHTYCKNHSQPQRTHVHYETQLPTRNMGIRNFELYINTISHSAHQPRQIIALLIDSTESKQQQKQWAQAQKLAAIGQLAAGVAHEINTPLGTINILASEAKEILEEAPASPQVEESKEFLQSIYDQTHRCKTIIQGLLNTTRSPGKNYESCSINNIIQRVIELSHSRLHGIEIHTELDDSLPHIVSDASGIERVLFNCLLNASDAVQENQGYKEIRVTTSQHDNFINITIRDNGPGIAKEELSHIFEPFYTTKPIGKGTGLGLYISYETIHDLGGQLTLESQVGKGTTAIIKVPKHHE